MPVLSLLRQGSPLANAQCQRDVLERDGQAGIPSFQATLAGHGVVSLTSRYLTSLQVNVGKLCNQTCGHCHVDAGPDRRELMTKEISCTASACFPNQRSRRWISPAVLRK